MRSYRSLLRTAAGLDPRARGSPEWLAGRGPPGRSRAPAAARGRTRPLPGGPAAGPRTRGGSPPRTRRFAPRPRRGGTRTRARGPPRAGRRVPARSVCQGRRASGGRCGRPRGHRGNRWGRPPAGGGREADGEIIAVGVAPPPYTCAAAREVPELKCPTTATTAGSAYSSSAARTAASSFPESSTIRSSSLRPRIPRLALIWFTASWAARSMEAPRGWENGPARPTAIGPVGRAHAASRTATTRARARRRPSTWPHPLATTPCWGEGECRIGHASVRPLHVVERGLGGEVDAGQG